MPKFVPRERKHRKLAKLKDGASIGTNGAPEANAIELLPADRKAQLKASALASEPHMSSKKRKRLDKYLDNKLRKEDTLARIKRLEEKQRNVDRSLLQSSQRLGRQHETKKEVFQRALREKEHGMNVEKADEVLFQKPGKKKAEVVVEEEEGEDSEDEAEEIEEDGEAGEGPTVQNGRTVVQDVSHHVPTPEDAPAAAPVAAPVQPSQSVKTFGGGLKRPLQLDESGRPVIKERKRRRTGPLLFNSPSTTAEPNELEWEGFSDIESSSDSRIDQEQEEDDDSDGDLASEIASDDGATSESSDDEEGDEASVSDGSTSQSASESDDADESPKRSSSSTRTSAFKAWAEQQRNSQIGFTPSANSNGTTGPSLPEVTPAVLANFQPRDHKLEQEPLPESLLLQSTAAAKDGQEVREDGAKRKAHAVHVERAPEIQAARLALPVLAEEQRIMEAVMTNDVVIVSGATGSGKTTQVPQFLYEYGFGDKSGPFPGMIGITQPRRVAALSMSTRVATELGPSHAHRIAHQIRFDSTVNPKTTAMKFMTDGVLLREMSEDFSLRKYSAVIIDEAHERTVNTDILIALMSRCVTIRRTLAKERPSEYTALKLVIMSATLRVEDFRSNARLFKRPPPIVEAEGRQYDVTVHWSRRTSHDFVEEAFRKVSRGHRKLPPGGMLVFLTGQQDIRELMRRLADVFECTEESGGGKAGSRRVESASISRESGPGEKDEEELEDVFGDDSRDDDGLPSDEGQTSASEAEAHEDDNDPDKDFAIEDEEALSSLQRIHLLPLYSQLPSASQLKVFQPPPPGSRLIILATNVAETSLTIPGIRYVFDCGRHKQRTWDHSSGSGSGSGVQSFRTTWISKASAEQRAGRAGRTGPGHAWRLYSSAVYEDTFPAWSEPEIMRASLEGVVLQLKGLGVERVDNFPWPSPPNPVAVRRAEGLLRNLGAIDAVGRITSAGRELGRYPLSPRFAQMLRLGVGYGCLGMVVMAVAALDVPELVVPESQLDLQTPQREGEEGRIWSLEDDARESARENRRKDYSKAMARLSRLDASKDRIRAQADALRSFTALLDYSSIPLSKDRDRDHDDAKEKFCRDNFLREKGMKEASQLRDQLTSIMKTVSPPSTALPSLEQEGKTKEPKEKQVAMLKQIIAAGFLDQIAIRADCLPSPPVEERKAKRAIDVKYRPLFSVSSNRGAISTRDEDGNVGEEEWVYIHPSSLLSRLPPGSTPRYIVYHTLQRSQPSKPGARSRVRMFPLTPVSGEQMATLARGTALLEIGKPVGKVEVLERNEHMQERRECDVLLSLKGDEGTLAWPLTRKRVAQKRVQGRGWEVETWK